MDKKIINEEYIHDLLNEVKDVEENEIDRVLEKAKKQKGLNYREIAILLQIEDEDRLEEIYKIAGRIKKDIYGKRVVIFAPLYISNYCVNNCYYCGYSHSNKMFRKKLTQDEIRDEVLILEKMGHKRLALEAGEDPINCDIDYIIESMNTIYNTYGEEGNIRRINVNIAATSVEDYKKIKEAGIGTYILFQETYNKKVYDEMHKNGPKANYEYHLTAFNRAMEAGIDDVGGGVLFGLYDYKFEALALMMHNEFLERNYGVGFHTISVPRLKKAEGMDLENFPYLLDDKDFKKLVAILRIAVPFTGIILSTRESESMREEVIEYGVSQVSAGSSTGVGGYKESEGEEEEDTSQFQVSDNRNVSSIIKDLLKKGHIPSYCTACYRMGRTGDRFMELARTGEIQNVCQPNSLITLNEYAEDYGDEELKNLVDKVTMETIEGIEDEKLRKLTETKVRETKEGKRDLYV